MSADIEITRESKPGLVVIGLQRAAFHAGNAAVDFAVRRACSLIDRARREAVQIVFIQQAHGHGPFAHGSDGWRLIDQVQPTFPDWVVQACEGDIFANTNLRAQLQAIGVGRLVFTGLDADSIAASSQSAKALGFDTVLAHGDTGGDDAFVPSADGLTGADTMSFA